MAERKAMLISFTVSCSKCQSNERDRFFKTLYGWEQRVPSENKTYVYKREGLLDKMPHMKVGQSSFIVPEDDFDEVISFFEQWSNKIIWKTFKVLLNKSDMDELFEDIEE